MLSTYPYTSQPNTEDVIYNLSTHYCDVKGVENEPRLKILQNVKNSYEVIDKIKKGIKGVPKGAKVLLGGSSQYIGILSNLAKTMRWQIHYYSSYDNDVFTAAFLNRIDRMEIEKMVNGQ